MSFLVFASPKSGTTWLQRLISCHPEALCAESRAFGDYFDPKSLSTPHLTVEKFVNVLSCYHAPAVPQLETGRVTYYRTLLFNVLDTIGATALSATAKSVYGEKFTPYPGTAKSALEVLREYHPQIKFINLTRDGRDVVVSGAVHWLNLSLRGGPARTPDSRGGISMVHTGLDRSGERRSQGAESLRALPAGPV